VYESKTDAIIFFLEAYQVSCPAGPVVIEYNLKPTLDEMLSGLPLDRVDSGKIILPIRFFGEVDSCPIPGLESFFSDLQMPWVLGLDEHVAVQLGQVDETYQRRVLAQILA
jgi:hypothetical protein